MAIGGYKFRGFHYPARTAAAGSAEENAIFLDWFKCRLAAFKASCEASGALWRILPSLSDMGAHTSDAWDDICIFELDDTRCNFGAFFQYGTEDKYMAMCVQNTGSASLLARRWYRYSSSTSPFDGSNDVIALDIAPITPENIGATPTGRMPFSGAKNEFPGNWAIDRSVSNVTNGIVFGFATKDADIIEFFSVASLRSSISASSISCLVISPDGFSSLCSPSDVYRSLAFSSGVSYRSITQASYTSSLNDNPVGFLRNTGELYVGDASIGGANKLGIFAENMGSYWPPTNAMPFVSPLVRNSVISANSAYRINNDGINSKGCIRVDLLATNTDPSQQQSDSTTAGGIYGGGNYLCIGGLNASGGSSYYRFQGAVYAGWDPSNPSILASTSWPDWPDAIEPVTRPWDDTILQ